MNDSYAGCLHSLLPMLHTIVYTIVATGMWKKTPRKGKECIIKFYLREIEWSRFVAIALEEGIVGESDAPDSTGGFIHGDVIAEGKNGSVKKY